MIFAPQAPALIRYRELPVTNFFEWDRVHEVRAVLRQLQLGQFRDAALLVDDMRRDDRISGCTDIRLSKLLGLPVTIEAVKLTRTSQRLQDAAQRLWSRMLPTASLAQLLQWGIMLGIGVGELIWDTKGPDGWIPRLKVWHPQFVRWDWSRDCFMLTTATGEIPLPNTDESINSDGHWVIFTPYGYRYGWLRAKVRPLAMPYLIRGWTYRDAARYSEVHGQPIRKAIAPTTASAASKDRFVDDVSNLGGESTLLLNQDPVGGKFDLELLEAKADTYQVFEMLLERVEESMANTLLGLNPGGKQPGLGSGQANQDESLREDTAAGDGEALADCLNAQVLHWFAQFNFGPLMADAAVASWNLDPPADELSEAQLLQALFTALQIAQAAGLPVDVHEILDAHGVPMLDPGDIIGDDPALQPGAPGAPPAPMDPNAPPPAPGDGQQPQPAQAVAADAADTEHPTGDQLPLVDFQGLRVRIENQIGTTRSGTDPDGKPWQVTMAAPYGYLEGVAGPDGDEVDVYLGPNPASPWVFVVHQHAPPEFRAWDEDKVMMGWDTPDAAMAAYLAHYNDPRFLGRMSMIPMATFQRKLKARASTGMIRAGAAPQLVPPPAPPAAPAPRAVALSAIRLDSVLDPATREALAGSIARTQQLAGRPRSVRARAARYADRLATRGARLGGAAVRADLAVLMRAVRDARDLDDLKARVIAAHAGMDPAKLARIVERATIMAQLAGRNDVLAAM